MCCREALIVKGGMRTREASRRRSPTLNSAGVAKSMLINYLYCMHVERCSYIFFLFCQETLPIFPAY